MDTATDNNPIINCHTHIFTGDCVPPWIARTIIPAPFHKLLPISAFVAIVRWWFKYPGAWPFKPWYKKLARRFYFIKISITRYWILKLFKVIIGLIIATSLFHDLYPTLVQPAIGNIQWLTNVLDPFNDWLTIHGILIPANGILSKAILLIVLMILFPSGRNLLWYLLTHLFGFLKMLPGKHTMELFRRYMTIVRFARYDNQGDILTKLTNQYPPGSSVVVLPMDMEFMGAGVQRKPFDIQMAELATLKKNRPASIHPFMFVDPRRTTAGTMDFLTYKIVDNKVVLEECFIKEYMEQKDFSGFKIYPALGYFPFDTKLLALWKYAADNGIPLMTHCIRGVIYYRGPKKREWDTHPVFKEDDQEPLLLPQMKAMDVQEIFTHPLNYACLLKKEWLAIVVGQCGDEKIKQLFGYDAVTKTIARGLGHLKICFAHFGGDDEWAKFMEKDRDNYSSQLVKYPDKGIDFLANDGVPRPGKAEQIWRSVDWYSIICSLVLQHKNVYADISYILHSDEQILPLLKQTLRNDKLKNRILYGTDFYVVRNHKSDKKMLADMRGGLSEQEFNQLARINPVTYLRKGPTEE